jgi:tRNA uridine 5-carbamoylmethylation protein Kti12
MTIPRISIIVGLPGSGKTTYGILLHKIFGDPFFDDISVEREAYDSLKKAVSLGQDVIVADPYFCKEERIKSFLNSLERDVTTSFHYFSNELDVCAQNVSTRNDGRLVPRRFLESLSKSYCPPPHSIPCFRPNRRNPQ